MESKLGPKCSFLVSLYADGHRQQLSTRRFLFSSGSGLRLNRRHSEKTRKEKLCVRATASPLDLNATTTSVPLDLNATSVPLPTDIKISGARWLDAFYRFTRPHTVIGTAIGIISISLLAVESQADMSLRFVVGLLQALVPAIFMNIYIVGLNQISDVEIDKVNKPYLPLASGEFSLGTGVALVVLSALLSLGSGILINSKPLLWALTVSWVLGTAYSIQVPFLRWKRSAIAAASCILSVRAIVVQLAFFQHMQAFVLGKAPILPRSLVFGTAFMCFFSVVIALFKDIPDVEGDKTYGIQSFSVRLGQKKVFWTCIGLLQSAYAVAMVVGASSPLLWSKISMILGHAALAAILWHKSQRVDLSSKSAIASFYMFIWKLFYAEYFLIPFMR